MDVGRFFLRILYTGSIVESDWIDGDQVACEADEIPLRLLLGGLSLAKLYQIVHLMKPFVDVLKQRLSVSTFDTICAHAVDLDVTELRRYCLNFAETHLSKGSQVRTEVDLTEDNNEESAEVEAGTPGEIVSDQEDDDGLGIRWENEQFNSFKAGLYMIRAGMIRKTSDKLYSMYQKQELSPHVLFELAALWDVPSTAVKRRKLY